MREYYSYDRVEDMQEYSAKKQFECLLNAHGMPIQINGVDDIGVITNEFNPYAEDKEDRKIKVKINTPFERGDSILFENEPYLVITDVDKQYAGQKPIYKDAKISKCNQMLNHHLFKNSIPCILTNDSYGVKTNYNNDFLADTDAKVKIILWNSDEVNKIKKDHRYVFSNSKFMIYKVIDINFFRKNKCELICKKDKYMEGLDDLKNNLAYNGDVDNENNNTNISISGLDRIKINTIEKYICNTSANIEWYIDDVVSTIGNDIAKEIVVEGKKNNECSIKGLLMNEMFILSARDIATKKVLATKNIYVVK